MSSLVFEKVVSSILKAFPMPELLSFSNVAVDIADGGVRFVEVVNKGSDIWVPNFGFIPAPSLKFEDFNEKNKEELIQVLTEQLFKKGYQNVRVLIHEDEVYVFRNNIHTKKEKDIRQEIESILEENVPIPPIESIFEHEIVRKNIGNESLLMSVSVISEKTIDVYNSVVKKAGLVPVSFDTESRSLGRIIRNGGEKVVAVINMRENHSVFSIYSNNTISFASSVEIGSKNIIEVLTKTYNVNYEEARRIRNKELVGSHQEDQKIFNAIVPIISALRDELVKMLSYWRAEAKKGGDSDVVDCIYFFGSDGLIPGVVKYLEATTKIDVKVPNVWLNFSLPKGELPPIEHPMVMDYASLLGLFLE